MPHTLFLSVEQVPSDTPQSKVQLGVTFTILPGSAPDQLARPWLWNISYWTAWAKLDTDPQWTLLQVAPNQTNPPSTDLSTSNNWSGVHSAVLANLEAAISAIPNWPQTQPKIATTIDLKDGQSASGEHKYLSLLANAASGPYPVPQNLQLSFSLWIKKSDVDKQFPTGKIQYLVAPTFSLSGVTAAPGTTPPIQANDLWNLNATGVQMYAQFCSPASASFIDFSSLWLSAPPTPPLLVSDWSAHLYELAGPYLNLAALLINTKYVTKEILPDNSTDWLGFRVLVVNSLYDLLHAAALSVPNPPPPPSPQQWCSTLQSAVQSTLPNLPALNVQDNTPRASALELNDLHKLVTTVTSGETLLSLIPVAAQGTPQGTTPNEVASALLVRLQVQLANNCAQRIATACQGNGAKFPAMAGNLTSGVIMAYVLFRSVMPLGTPFPTIPAPLPSQPPAWISKLPTATIQADLLADILLQATGTSNGGLPATTKAPPMVIPVLDLRSSADTAATTTGPIDPLNGIRGLGVLMRRSFPKPTDWRCLNIGSLQEGPNLPILVASRPGYNRQLLTGFLLYDNGPVLCENFLHSYMNPGANEPDNRLAATKDPTDIPAVFHYMPYEFKALQGLDDYSALYGTPMLQAGAKFDVGCFAVSNSGALPVALRHPSHPAKLKTTLATITPPSLQSIPYERTVPVGTIELRNSNGTTVSQSPGILPSIPANVWPRAVETIVPRGGAAKLSQPLTDTTTPGFAERSTPPLLLLVPPDTAYPPAKSTTTNLQFSLKLPSIDTQTWDRTIGYTLDKTTRTAVLDLAYKTLKLNRSPEITDPLIASADITLYRWNEKAFWEQAATKNYTVANDLLKQEPAMPGVETNPIFISINVGPTTTIPAGIQVRVLPEPDVNPAPQFTSLLPSLQPGDVYLLEAKLNLDPTKVTLNIPGYPTSAVAFQLLLEIASTAMPPLIENGKLTHLFTASTLSVNQVPFQKVVVSLDATPTSPSDPWRNVNRVDILRQTWFWTGRAQPSVQNSDDPSYLVPGYFPASATPGSQEWEEWAKIEFAERPWTDHVELPTERTGTPPTSFLWQQDFSLDPRATFLRFAPRVYSRYEGAYLGLASQGITTVGVLGNDQWRPCFLKSRAKSLTLPRLKALIPLTESAFTQGTPGILAVFDGPAFEQAGLAERLVASIALVQDPDTAPDPKNPKWEQQGPDFLMNQVTPIAGPSLQNKLPLVAIGPIGHTLDSTASSFPKFLSSSWIIRPDVTKTTLFDFSWWFANLEFHLKSDPPSSVYPDIQSQTVSGSWIQFLPGFQDDKGKSLAFNSLQLTRVGDTSLRIEDLKAGSFNSKEPGYHLAHYLLITREVRDITGRLREAYVGIAYANSAGTWTMLPKSNDPNFSLSSTPRLRARFLDIRAGDIGRSASDADFWTRILGSDLTTITDSTRATIVSVSPIIAEGDCSR